MDIQTKPLSVCKYVNRCSDNKLYARGKTSATVMDLNTKENKGHLICECADLKTYSSQFID